MEDSEGGARARGPDRQVEQWLQFALRQEGRVAPHPCGRPGGDAAAGPAAGFRLALSHLESLPLFQGRDRPFDVRLGVTLFDDDAGCFFGPTARSAAVPYDMRRSKGKRGFHVDLDSTFYLSTRAPLAAGGPPNTSPAAGSGGALPFGTSSGGGGGGVLAVVEVVLVERGDGGLVSAEYSAAWCAIPLEVQPGSSGGVASGGSGALIPAAAGGSAAAVPGAAAVTPRAGQRGKGVHGPHSPAPGSPYSPLRAVIMAARLGAQFLLCVPLFVGSPRFLLLQRALPAAQCPPPPQLLADGAECRLYYQFEPCPDMAGTWSLLLPEDFLVSSRDLVPGVQRQPLPGSVSSGLLDTSSQLAPPRLHSVQAVVLAGLRVHLPEGFVEAVRRHGGGAGRLLAVGECQRGLRLRVSVHNGRRFVGPAAECWPASLEPVEGRRGEHLLVLGRDAPLAWVPTDRRVVLVLELVLAPGSGGSSNGGEAGLGSELVLGWTAVAPFRWHGGGSSSSTVAALAEGPHLAALRSGPGRWLRPSPVLDWRRLLEHANRSSPLAPTVSFSLLSAPGQAIWPPPAAAVPLRAVALRAVAPATAAAQPALAAGVAAGVAAAAQALAAGGPSEQERRLTAASEAETLQSLQASPRGHKAAQKPGQGASSRKNSAVGSKPIEPQITFQAWQIHAHHDAAPGDGSDSRPGAAARAAAAEVVVEEGAPWWEPPRLPSIRTRPAQGAAAALSLKAGTPEEAAALYAGSPTKQARQGARLSAADVAAAAAASAVPAAAAVERDASLQAELGDKLVTAAASLQLLGFEAAEQQLGGAACELAPSLPERLHFTYRFLHSGSPAVTAPLHLAPLGNGWSAAGGGGGGSRLYALAGEADDSYGRDDPEVAPPAPELPLQLLDVAALEQHAAELAAQGAPPAAAAGLARQLRLRAARYLAERRLQLDVWDSDSLLQVGTLSVPLHSLLRQGLPAAEAVLRVPVSDQAQGIVRLEGRGAGSEGTQLCAAPIRGSFLLRLACRGAPLPPGLGCGSSCRDSSRWPASPVKRGPQAVVVQQGARQSPEGWQQRQRQQHQQGAPGEEGEEAGRRDAILRRLQAELPSCLAVCAAPGEAVGFECEFVNSSSEEGWFSLSLGAGNSGGSADGARSAGPAAGAELSLVTDVIEWESLAPQAMEAGLAAEQQQQRTPGSGSPRAIGSARFRLAPRERCLLRFKLSRSLQAGQLECDEAGEQQLAPGSSSSSGGGSSTLGWHDIRISRSSHGSASSRGPYEPAAAFRVAVLPLAAPLADRTLRLYCPAGAGSAAAAVHAVQLSELPGSSRLLAAARGLVFASSSPEAAAAVRQGCVLLTSTAPAAGASSRFLLAAYSSAGSGSTGPSGSPLETWEVFLHGLPAVRLAASVGTAATARRLLPEVSAGPACELSCHWRGARPGELTASVGMAAAVPGVRGGGSSGGRLALSYEPASIDRRELLLSVTLQPAGRRSRRQQAGLMLVCLDSTSTTVSRSFEVAVPAGQAVSKKVRYTSPYPEPRRFTVRLPGGNSGSGPMSSSGGGSARSQLLRVGRPVFELGCRETTAIRLGFDGAAAPVASAAGRRQRHEVLALLESAPVGGGDGCVEEVFRIMVTVN
ncbi:hypothetical protein ABPG75_011141 [Micractinium tetrahymenae]